MGPRVMWERGFDLSGDEAGENREPGK